jgi:hypothetical protein
MSLLWLSDALQTIISMSLKVTEEMNTLFMLDVLVESTNSGLDIELGDFANKHEQGGYCGD